MCVLTKCTGIKKQNERRISSKNHGDKKTQCIHNTRNTPHMRLHQDNRRTKYYMIHHGPDEQPRSGAKGGVATVLSEKWQIIGSKEEAK